MGADFLNSYTKMVDGEKDPRNLMLLFAMDRVILLEFDISQMVEVSSSDDDKVGPKADYVGLLRYHFLLFPNIFQTTT